ncbi:hypothetical protein EMPS_10856 [Entomortierella parvispora]|uniref:Uncharacterized protein n=1 Tax=Entomortierella parvispora TaxID=205924 RepID=A0A9P3HLP8_9FUNG|nr:hypothetical protein EMPS_10856 [Entomortierella parvispora]
MSKSCQPSAVSPSASASSHDTHSLPPNFKGAIQRYLAVSLPTVTFSQELIEVLDEAGILIPSRIKVTMRWWKEDASSSLSVYPNINGLLHPAIAAHQSQLRLEQGDDPHIDGSLLPTQAYPQTQTESSYSLQKPDLQPQTRCSMDVATTSPPSKKPWVGARFLNALIRRKKGSGQTLKGTRVGTPHPQPHAPLPQGGHLSPTQDTTTRKPLPLLPPAAFPLTVAYPIRCSLEQLRRYFLELSVLTLDIHIAPDLVASTTVQNLSDLFHNINGTFSGVFPFTHIVKNASTSLTQENSLRPGTVLGMVVFQAWAQDTSQVSETSEESESASTTSMSIPQHYKRASFNSRHSNSRSQLQGSALPRGGDVGVAHHGTRKDFSRQLHPSMLSEGLAQYPTLLNRRQLPPHLRSHLGDRHHRQHLIDGSRPLTRHSREQKVTIPEPRTDIAARTKAFSRRFDESQPYENRPKSQDTQRSNAANSQTSRSRPRSGATAAAIGRLDAVLSRGQDLLQGMRTSLALDPLEVRARSSKPSLTTDLHNPDDDKLPYWPSKSRFILEVAIPTAYLTTRGLLKGSAGATELRPRHHGRRQHEKDATLSNLHSESHEPGLTSFMGSFSQKDSATRSLRRSVAPIPFGVAFSSAGRSTGSLRKDYQSSEKKPSKQILDKTLNSDTDRHPPLARPQVHAFRSSPSPDLRRSGPSTLSALRPSLLTRQGYKRSSSHRSPLSDDTFKSQKRRLSDNDRLQIRMNPRAGELFADLPDLFPVRSMSALLKPEYPSTSEGSHVSEHRGSDLGMTSNASESSSHISARSERRGLSGRQSRLQKRPKESTTNQHGLKHGSAQDRRANAYSKASRIMSITDPIHAQHFDFKAQCPLALTPEIMAACMLENISVELWKLNHKRQTMIELGTAKLPLHKILGRIIQKDVALSSLHADKSFTFRRDNLEPERHSSRAQRRKAEYSRFGKDNSSCREGWRLEPSLYDIRSRHGTVIGQLDADVWIHPRSRSNSLVVSAAA